MYIPVPFEENDEDNIASFIRQFPFATLVSNGKSLQATHLPFLLNHNKTDNKTILFSHMAAANPQYEILKNQDNEVLVIFQGPHAYISPEWYENKKTVPTWNYTAVHAYGKVIISDDENNDVEFLKLLIAYFEPGFIPAFVQLPQSYLHALMQEIKVFKIEVTRFEACFKLSQNKTLKDQENIISHLRNSKNFQAKELANFMENKLNKKQQKPDQYAEM